MKDIVQISIGKSLSRQVQSNHESHSHHRRAGDLVEFPKIVGRDYNLQVTPSLGRCLVAKMETGVAFDVKQYRLSKLHFIIRRNIESLVNCLGLMIKIKIPAGGS